MMNGARARGFGAARPWRSAPAFCLSALLAACSSSLEADADPDFDGPGPYGSGGTNSSGSPNATNPNGSSTTPGNNGAPSTNPGTQTGDVGQPGPLNGSGGAGGSSSSGGVNTGTGGSTGAGVGGGTSSGTGGSSGVPVPDPTNPNPDPTTPNPDPTTGPTTPTPTGPDIPCPAGATFCSGFEGPGLPAPAQFVIGGAPIANPFLLDTTQKHSGAQSFMITPAGQGFGYRALTIPAPGQNFWARLFVRVSSEFGDGNHDSLFGASDAGQLQDHNNEKLIELSEQFNYMLLNTDDCTVQCNMNNSMVRLPANTWACFEAHYDGAAGRVEIFLDGTRIIDDTQAIYRFTYQTFRLGYMRFNTERTVWFDDVVVSTNRPNCQ
jgi:hypothetical protein